MYMDYFGEDFSIDDEPFKYGEYKGDNKKKYKNLAKVLDDMCTYYNGIKKQSDRYDALGEFPLSMYEYTYNVRQMILLIFQALGYKPPPLGGQALAALQLPMEACYNLSEEG